MAIDFKLPASSYEEICKMIRAYGNISKEKNTLDELSRISGVPNSNLSRNSVFLSSIGIIDEKDHNITEKGKKLSLSYDHKILSEIAENWKNLIEDSRNS